jgi:hypothetical protein
VVVAAVLVGCGTGGEGGGGSIGRACDPGSACDEGLTCITEEAFDDAGDCADGESFCSVACATDDECTAALGDGHICVAECGSGMCFVGSSG